MQRLSRLWSTFTPRQRTACSAVIVCVVIAMLVVIWLLAIRGVFGPFAASAMSNKLLPSATTGNAKAATHMPGEWTESGDAKGATGARANRTPTVIGNIFDAFGKPADVEVCGFGVQHVEEFPMGISLPPVTAANETLNAAARDLASSKIDADRALGLYLQAKLAGDAAMERAHIQEPGCGQSAPAGSGKPDNPPCSENLPLARQAARMAAAKPLIDMALSTSDPNVYATAYYFCNDPLRPKGEMPGACSSISAEGWARIDPQNLFPALLARNPGPFKNGSYKSPANDPIDDTALPTALYDTRSLRYDRVMAQENFKQEPLYMQTAIAMQLIGELASSGFKYYSSAINYCRADEVARPARSQICGNIAETMAEQGKSIIDVAIALKLGEQGRRSETQMAKLAAEKADYSLLLDRLGIGASAYSCEGMALTVKYFADFFARGERAMMADEPKPDLKVKP